LRGNHLIEVYGAGLVDDTTSWYFKINNQGWIPFTVKEFIAPYTITYEEREKEPVVVVDEEEKAPEKRMLVEDIMFEGCFADNEQERALPFA
jgi:hypothetical protein